MKRFLWFLASLSLCTGVTLAAQGGPRNAWVLGNREFAHNGRAHFWNSKSGVFHPHADLPPIYVGQATEVKDIAWDGTWAYRVVAIDGHRELQHGMVFSTPNGTAWFWRPGMRMPDRSELVIAAGRRALVRQDVPAKEDEQRELGQLHLLLFDLVEERQQLVGQERGWPERMTVSGCVIDGDLYAFWGTGKILRLKQESSSPETLVENFWSDLDIPLAPTLRNFMGKTIFEAPTGCRKPFFSEVGTIYMAYHARRKTPYERVEQEATLFFELADPEMKKRLIERGEYPVSEAVKQRAAFDGLFFLEWDPQTRKTKLIEKEKWQGLVKQPWLPSGMEVPYVDGWCELKGEPIAFQVDSNGRIEALESLINTPDQAERTTTGKGKDSLRRLPPDSTAPLKPPTLKSGSPSNPRR